MIGTMTPPEAVAVLCLLMINADENVRAEEINAMLTNPFFEEHISDKIGDHSDFLARFSEARREFGSKRLEHTAIRVLKSAFPALQIKTVALLTLIADADGIFDQKEKELLARVAQELKLSAQDVDPELQKMRKSIRDSAEEAGKTAGSEAEASKE